MTQNIKGKVGKEKYFLLLRQQMLPTLNKLVVAEQQSWMGSM